MKRVGGVSETPAPYRSERGDGWSGEGARVRVQKREIEFV